jgi:hypothetical protein
LIEKRIENGIGFFRPAGSMAAPVDEQTQPA